MGDQQYSSTMLPVCDIEISLCDSFCYIFEEWVTDIPVRLGHIREVPFEPPFSGAVAPGGCAWGGRWRVAAPPKFIGCNQPISDNSGHGEEQSNWPLCELSTTLTRIQMRSIRVRICSCRSETRIAVVVVHCAPASCCSLSSRFSLASPRSLLAQRAHTRSCIAVHVIALTVAFLDDERGRWQRWRATPTSTQAAHRAVQTGAVTGGENMAGPG